MFIWVRRTTSLYDVGYRGLAGWLMLLVAFTIQGCATSRTPKEPLVQSLHLLCMPVAVNLDNQPGPDGFSVRVYPKGPKSSKSVLVPDGAIEIAMYDGLLADGKTPVPAPLRKWRFAGGDLKKHAGQSAVGAGYRFTLRWDEARPTLSRITIVARYLPASGPPVVAAPSSVAIGTK